MRNRNSLINKLSLILVLLFFQTNINFAQQNNNTPPNIIIFLVDDMGLMDTSVPFLTDKKGKPKTYPLNDFYITPNMEQLADQGIRFTNFYAHSVCSPTRASILTGQNSARHRTTNWIHLLKNNKNEFGPSNWNWEGLSKSSVTLPRLLQKSGYKTIHVGKAHFGPNGYDGENPLNLGFDVNIAGCGAGHPASYYGRDGYGHIKGDKTRAVPGLEKYWDDDVFLTEALTLEANNKITEAKNEGKPFFLYMSHYAVHQPFQSDPRFASHYENSGKTKEAQAYATLIEGMDKSLGDIMAHVKELGLGENTLILFLGDNGSDAPLPDKDFYSSSEPLRGKKAMHWEGGMRVPFIAAWVTPNKRVKVQKGFKISKGKLENQMGTIFDLFPTICDLSHVEIPASHKIDGYDLKPQLKGKTNDHRDNVFLNHFPHNHRSSYFTSFVKDNWKVVYHFQVKGEPKYDLFNLNNDPFEAHNLAETNKEQLKVMMKLLQENMEKMGAIYPEKDGQVLKIIQP
ncbi:sulfatase [Aestuariibaculum sediminum]|uniref:Sulfatase n=1 Tax=Aestuariibaculum sediminum TaxID=2770637 RepID=A0A8J6Q366_9FLAO|nr:sulfatase [Aestuariibaculum sediminum]MBD0833149.1 sulfatase [Aestuariibaculum sediminum]